MFKFKFINNKEDHKEEKQKMIKTVRHQELLIQMQGTNRLLMQILQEMKELNKTMIEIKNKR